MNQVNLETQQIILNLKQGGSIPEKIKIKDSKKANLLSILKTKDKPVLSTPDAHGPG